MNVVPMDFSNMGCQIVTKLTKNEDTQNKFLYFVKRHSVAKKMKLSKNIDIEKGSPKIMF